jgi:hypothetical protein
MFMMRRRFVRSLAALAVALSSFSMPGHAEQLIQAHKQNLPIQRRRAPDGRHNALAFVRTELFFGTAKPDGAVTGQEFNTFRLQPDLAIAA